MSPREEPERNDEHTEVYLEHAGQWRWRWVGPDEQGRRTALASNTAVPSQQAAVEAARTAYPHLPVVQPEPLLPSASTVRRRLWRWAALAGGAVLAVRTWRRRTAPGGQPAQPGQPVPRGQRSRSSRSSRT